jgi:phage-related protein
VVGKQIALTHGLIKKTQKTPKREIERAKACRQDYFEKND